MARWAYSVLGEFEHELRSELGRVEAALTEWRPSHPDQSDQATDELATAFALVDWSVHELTPRLLEARSRGGRAPEVRELERVVDFASCLTARELALLLAQHEEGDVQSALRDLLDAATLALWADAAQAVADRRPHPFGGLVARHARGMSFSDPRDAGYAISAAGSVAAFAAAVFPLIGDRAWASSMAALVARFGER